MAHTLSLTELETMRAEISALKHRNEELNCKIDKLETAIETVMKWQPMKEDTGALLKVKRYFKSALPYLNKSA